MTIFILDIHCGLVFKAHYLHIPGNLKIFAGSITAWEVKLEEVMKLWSCSLPCMPLHQVGPLQTQ